MDKIDATGWTTSEKLETLATYLEKVSDDAFFMDRWAQGKRAPTFEDLSLARFKEGSCGTSACALGTAATIFEGIEIEQVVGYFYVHAAGQEQAPHHSGTVALHDHSYEAGARFFGIAKTESDWLFQPGNYGVRGASKARVAERIRDVAAKYRARESKP